MDWNMILFVARWAVIGIFYSVLLFLLFGVYREMSRSVRKEKPPRQAAFGWLRVLAAGDDARIKSGSILDLPAETRLGTGKDNEIILGDSRVSTHHARLRWDGAAWWVEDLHSQNGTQVNHQKCAPSSPQPLSRGSLLGIGGMEFELIVRDED
jgi:hypothetical protein